MNFFLPRDKSFESSRSLRQAAVSPHHHLVVNTQFAVIPEISSCLGYLKSLCKYKRRFDTII